MVLALHSIGILVAGKASEMDRMKNAATTDFDLLNQLKPLSFLSHVALHELATTLDSSNFSRREVVLSEKDLAAGVHILLRGVAKITCLRPTGKRVTIALVAPGPIPQFVSLPVERWHFQCEARSDCRVGSVSWDEFDMITRDAPRSDLRKFHENNLTQRYRFFGASLDLRERLLFTLLQLCTNFGVDEVTRYPFARPHQPRRFGRPGGCDKAQSHPTPGRVGARASGYSSRPATDCEHG